PFARMYVNSIVTSTLIIGGQIVTSALAAYALTQLRFRGRGLAFLFIISTMMVPIQATFIPAYIIVSRLGWIDTHSALLVPLVSVPRRVLAQASGAARGPARGGSGPGHRGCLSRLHPPPHPPPCRPPRRHHPRRPELRFPLQRLLLASHRHQLGEGAHPAH